MSRELKRFDAQGEHLVTFGGEGEGPGEFKRAMGLQRLGDTVIVIDSDGTVAGFDPDGRLLAEFSARGLAVQDEDAGGKGDRCRADIHRNPIFC